MWFHLIAGLSEAQWDITIIVWTDPLSASALVIPLSKQPLLSWPVTLTCVQLRTERTGLWKSCSTPPLVTTTSSEDTDGWNKQNTSVSLKMLTRTRTSPDMYEITARHRFLKKKCNYSESKYRLAGWGCLADQLWKTGLMLTFKYHCIYSFKNIWLWKARALI